MLGNNGYIGRNPGDSAVTVARRVYKPTTNTTEFDFSAGYDIEYFDVYVNGLKKVRGTDYSASSDNKTFTLTSAAGSGDVVEAVAYKAFNVTRDSIGQVDGEIFLGDNKKVHLGNSNDFQFFHDPTFTQLDASGSSISGGTASVMQDDGSGPLVFKTNAADGQGAFQFFDKLWRPKLKIFSGPTEGVNVYHGSDTSNAKISTRPYGVKVTGITSSTTFYAQGASGISTFRGKVSLGSSVFDSNGGTGTNQQVLISIPGVGVSWANNSGSGGGASDTFKTISVDGQDDVVADSATDTLTLVASTGMTITTNASGDSITFTSSGGTVSSGSFTASAGVPSTLESYAYDSAELVFEYTVFVKNGSDYQTQKLLVMRDGTTVDSTQYAVMFSNGLLVQLDATISGGNVNLRATPETGVNGSTTYRIKREVM